MTICLVTVQPCKTPPFHWIPRHKPSKSRIILPLIATNPSKLKRKDLRKSDSERDRTSGGRIDLSWGTVYRIMGDGLSDFWNTEKLGRGYTHARVTIGCILNIETAPVRVKFFKARFLASKAFFREAHFWATGADRELSNDTSFVKIGAIFANPPPDQAF